MHLEVKPEGIAEAITAYNGILGRWLSRVEASSLTVGQRAAEIIKRYYRGAAETEPDRTAVRTGRLRSAYDALTERAADSVAMKLGVVRPGIDAKVLAYAAIHEFGGTITAKRAQKLAIPTAEAKTAAGVARGGPRDFPHTFFTPTGIYQKLPGEQRARKLFHRVRSVTIRARPTLKPLEPLVVAELNRRTIEDLHLALEAT